MGDFVGDVVMVMILLVFLIVGLSLGLAVVFRPRKRGRWGINLRPVRCPKCGKPAPAVRWPKNRRQALWGGWTCEACGTEFDKWGQRVQGAGGTEGTPGTSSDDDVSPAGK